MLLSTLMGQLRVVAFLEGVSFLVLLFIAMPLKYYAGQPEMVRYTGMAHGLLFVAYVVYVFLAPPRRICNPTEPSSGFAIPPQILSPSRPALRIFTQK